jgi:hypothetical protein
LALSNPVAGGSLPILTCLLSNSRIDDPPGTQSVTGLAHSQELKCIPDPPAQLQSKIVIAQRNELPPGRLDVNQTGRFGVFCQPA